MVHLKQLKPLGVIMSINKSQFFLVISLLSFPCLKARDPFRAMQDSFESMAKDMHDMMENMGKVQHDFFQSMRQEMGTLPSAEDGINVSVNEDDVSAKVKISGILADQFDANFTDSELVIKAPKSTVTIDVEHGIITVGIKQEVKEEKKEIAQEPSKDTQSKDMSKNKEARSVQYFSSASHIRQMLSKKVNLQDASIDYAKETKTLTVTIPAKEAKKPSKNIPVNVK